MIVRPESAIDVARAVVTARDLDLEIAVRAAATASPATRPATAGC